MQALEEKRKMKVINDDCLKAMKSFSDKSFDLILTDPPYNAKNIGPNHRRYSSGIMQLPADEYSAFCKNWFLEADRISKKIVFTPGIANMCSYPQPYWVLCWHKPAAVSFNRLGGYNAWEPIFIYGKATQRIGQDVIKANTLNFTKGPERNHPCPKPLNLWRWLLERFSVQGDRVLDPFGGSGTTGVACGELERDCTLIEINPEYVDICNKRKKLIIKSLFARKSNKTPAPREDEGC